MAASRDAMIPRRLVLLFDATWTEARTQTNVERLWKAIAAGDAAGVPQVCKYIAGIGVAPGLRHLLAGAFGLGVSSDIEQGYHWLAEGWCEGDEIWLFGFSRGAFEARSLAGFIRKCGLLRADAHGKVAAAAVAAAYALYRDDLHPDDPRMQAFRAAHSREVRIRFIGVWDTVGDLGIPGVPPWFPFARSRYAFHDTELSHIVQYACQALALDEHRATFRPTKWTWPARLPAGGRDAMGCKAGQIEIEQRWFVGAHSDVGGGERSDGAGHRPDTLPGIPLAWMQARARAAGLAFQRDCRPAPGAELDLPNPSYRTFLLGLYKCFSRRYQRVLGGGVNETIDPSVWMKMYLQRSYRPGSVESALRAGLIQPGSTRVS